MIAPPILHRVRAVVASALQGDNSVPVIPVIVSFPKFLAGAHRSADRAVQAPPIITIVGPRPVSQNAVVHLPVGQIRVSILSSDLFSLFFSLPNRSACVNS